MWNVNAVMPPYAAMYWSCLPIGSLRMSISMWQASSRQLLGGDELALEACSAFSSATVKVLDEPRPAVRGHVGELVELDVASAIP